MSSSRTLTSIRHSWPFTPWDDARPAIVAFLRRRSTRLIAGGPCRSYPARHPAPGPATVRGLLALGRERQRLELEPFDDNRSCWCTPGAILSREVDRLQCERGWPASWSASAHRLTVGGLRRADIAGGRAVRCAGVIARSIGARDRVTRDVSERALLLLSRADARAGSPDLNEASTGVRRQEAGARRQDRSRMATAVIW